jgi:ABC-type branched-subunit amino acid transport system substrate-binding protein
MFLNDDGQVKVLDFGIARLREPGGGLTTNTGFLLGTPAYMAPEQALGNAASIDGRTDLYAAAATMFTLISGKLVHDAPNGAQMVIRAATVRAPSVSSVTSLAAPLAAVIDRALEFDPENRWPSAAAMREALAAAATAVFGEVPGLDARLPLLSLPPRPPAPDAANHTSSAFMRTELAPSGPPGHAHVGLSTSQAMAGDVKRTLKSGPPPPPRSARLLAPALLAGALVAAVAGLFVASRFRPVARKGEKAAPSECASSKTCASRGDFVCRAGSCVPLGSQDCRPLDEPGDVASDDTLWIGVMFPQSGDAADAFGRADTNAADLARHDFAEVAHGILPRAGPARRVALVACDDAADPDRAARHLALDLHVPAVIGFYQSQEAIDLARSLFLPNGVLVVAANNRNPLVTAVPTPPGSPRLIWRVNASATQFAAPLSKLVTEVLFPALQRDGTLAKGEHPRIAVVRDASPTSLAFGDVIAVDWLRASGGAFDGSFRQFVVGDEAADIEKAVAEVVAYRPQIIVDEFDTIGKAGVFIGTEAHWPAGVRRPRYVVADLLDAELTSAIAEVPERRLRVLGADTPSNTAPNMRFALRYNEFYSPKVTSTSAQGVAYDAMYLLAYAATASIGPMDGASIARAIPLLAGPGKAIDVGATGIFEATNVLRAGSPIALTGTVGRLAFDSSGDRIIDFSVFCFRAANGRAEIVDSGMLYRGGEHRLEGELRCP